MSFIEFNQIKKSYDGKKLVVKDFNIKISKGEFVTMLGPSGSGKTTCLMMLAGFETVTDGEIMLDGKPIKKLAPHKRNIGTVFQNYALFPHMTIEQNLAYPLKIRRISNDEVKKKVDEYLSLVQLSHFQNRYPSSLSGGQKQRIALARALIFNPQLILMDEPLSSLDKHLREIMQYEIKKIHKKLNVTVLYVTHDQNEALVMSDRVAVFNDGIVQQVGTPNDLYNFPKNSFVANFIGENNILDGILKSKNNDYCKVELQDKRIIKANPINIGNLGEKVSVCVRPERLFINDMAKKCDNIIDSVVEEITFVGEHSRILVETLGEQLIIKMQNTSLAYKPKIGEKIKIGWYYKFSPALNYLDKSERKKLKE